MKLEPCIIIKLLRGEGPSSTASSTSVTEVKHGGVQPETGWVTYQMNSQNISVRRPSEGAFN